MIEMPSSSPNSDFLHSGTLIELVDAASHGLLPLFPVSSLSPGRRLQPGKVGWWTSEEGPVVSKVAFVDPLVLVAGAAQGLEVAHRIVATKIAWRNVVDL